MARLLIIKFINECVYWHGTGGISDCLNRLLQEVLGCAPAIILICLCKVKIFPLLEVTQQSYPIFYNGMKVCIVNLLDSVNISDIDHRPYGITCST